MQLSEMESILKSCTPKVQEQFGQPVVYTMYKETANVFLHGCSKPFVISKYYMSLICNEFMEFHQKVNKIVDLINTHFILAFMEENEMKFLKSLNEALEIHSNKVICKRWVHPISKENMVSIIPYHADSVVNFSMAHLLERKEEIEIFTEILQRLVHQKEKQPKSK